MEPGTKCTLTNFNRTCIALLIFMDPIAQNETVVRAKNMKTAEATEVNGCSVWVNFGNPFLWPTRKSSDLWLNQASPIKSKDLLQTGPSLPNCPNSCFCVFEIIKLSSAWQFCVLSATVCSLGLKSALGNYDGAGGQKERKEQNKVEQKWNKPVDEFFCTKK